jgi:DNA-binding transcriptional ArsR family regulator
MDKKSVLAAMAALGQDTRLDVFRLLVGAGPQGVPAGEIASRLGTVQNTMSAHLKILDQAGLVLAERDGRSCATSPTWPAFAIFSPTSWRIAAMARQNSAVQ